MGNSKATWETYGVTKGHITEQQGLYDVSSWFEESFNDATPQIKDYSIGMEAKFDGLLGYNLKGTASFSGKFTLTHDFSNLQKNIGGKSYYPIKIENIDYKNISSSLSNFGTVTPIVKIEMIYKKW